MKRIRNLIIALMGLLILGGTVAAVVAPAVTATAASTSVTSNGMPWLS